MAQFCDLLDLSARGNLHQDSVLKATSIKMLTLKQYFFSSKLADIHKITLYSKYLLTSLMLQLLQTSISKLPQNLVLYYVTKTRKNFY